MKKFVMILSAILLGWNVGFTQDNTGATQERAKGQKPVTSISISPTTLSLKEGDSPEQLKETIKPDNATNKDVSWSSSNDSIASVSNQGEVKPIKEGKVEITVVATEDSTKIAVCEVTVEANWESRCQTLKDENSKLNKQIQILNAQKYDRASDWIFIALAAFALVLIALLLILLIYSKREIKKLKSNFQSHIKELNNKAEWEHREKNGLTNRVNTLSSENKKLKDEIDRLSANAYLNQQRQQENNELQTQLLSQPQSLYADAIINGKFNRVNEQPNADTIFELKLSKPGVMQAGVIIYEGAYQLIKQRPEFLEGCEKQILGNSTVSMLREGVAQKDGSGKWIITTTPEVKIS